MTTTQGPAMATSTTSTLDSLHPDCPDWRRLGPTPADAALRAAAAGQQRQGAERESSWSTGFTRRRLLAGGLGVGVATLGSQLVTTRVAYAAPGTTTGTLVVVFLRGGMDGLSLLVPAGDADLARARPSIGVPQASLLAMDRGFGLHPAMAPLRPLLTAGRLAAVPGVTTPDLTRSHFQAQDCLERGGAAAGGSTGWLDRVLEQSGPGTTFRGVAVGGLMPRSLAGLGGEISFSSLADLQIAGSGNGAWPKATTDAIAALYTGVDDPLSLQTALGIEAVATAKALSASAPGSSSVTYPGGGFAAALKDVATLIKGGAGVRVACVDVGGWDMHTGLGTVDRGDMTSSLGELATALAAFTTDLGPLLDTTTVVTMSEFGRRVEQNASGGVDHGHGGASLVLGGGVSGGVKGVWKGLARGVLDQGDVPLCTDYRDLLGEVLAARFGLSAASVGSVFPGWRPTPVGVMA